MANIKSQKKRALTNAKKNLQNTSQKSELKTAIKKVLKAVEAKDKEAIRIKKIRLRRYGFKGAFGEYN